jgi:hypothetical protein
MNDWSPQTMYHSPHTRLLIPPRSCTLARFGVGTPEMVHMLETVAAICSTATHSPLVPHSARTPTLLSPVDRLQQPTQSAALQQLEELGGGGTLCVGGRHFRSVLQAGLVVASIDGVVLSAGLQHLLLCHHTLLERTFQGIELGLDGLFSCSTVCGVIVSCSSGHERSQRTVPL